MAEGRVTAARFLPYVREFVLCEAGLRMLVVR
jgi:hypothetical protein